MTIAYRRVLCKMCIRAPLWCYNSAIMRTRAVLSLGNFFCASHFFLVLYIVAPYLSTYIPQGLIGFVISSGALLTFVLFPFVPRIIRLIGARKLLLGIALGMFFLLLLLATGPGALSAITLIIFFCAVQPIIAYLLDLLLEGTIETEGETGRIRTAFITCGNMALVLAPLIVGLVLDGTDEYTRLFAVAAASLIPFFALFLTVRFPEKESPRFRNITDIAHSLLGDPDFCAVGCAQGLLQFFYHLAPFFVPLYLHTVLGIPWSDLGWIFFIMLLPFVLLEYPMGWLADRVFGDKEIMALGFLILGATFAALAFVTAATPLVYIAITLLLTRVGAVMVEASSEAHFFRRVSQKDADTIAVFRMMRPVGALAGPFVGSLILLSSSYSTLFFVLGIFIIFAGVLSALTIRDVR